MSRLWGHLVESHSQTLARIVAELIALVSLMAHGSADRISKGLYRNVLRVLRPAESAVRRLIVIEAGDIVLDLPPREQPDGKEKKKKGSARTGKRGGRKSFQLFDPRRNDFAKVRRKRRKPITGPGPRILSFGFDPRAPMFQPAFQSLIAPAPEPVPDDGKVDATRLSRRLAAIKAALEDIPGQAMRLARWQERRRQLPVRRFVSAIRPGRPPGSRRRPRHEVDHVLKECHMLAWDVIRSDTS
jgi:hypothetical protein